MAGKLHPTRWKELEPEFEAFQHIKKADELLASSGTDTAGRARYFTEHGLRALHPATQDEEAHLELEQRRAGTWEDNPAPRQRETSTRRTTASTGEVERENAQLRARLAELELQQQTKPNPGNG
jgi:hypothetical protein